MAKTLTKIFAVEVPKESTDHDIDDFLGNIIQYKINGEWKYDYDNDLPTGQLKVIGLASESVCSDMNLSFEKKWILIEKVN
jgi:hypothetical protein